MFDIQHLEKNNNYKCLTSNTLKKYFFLQMFDIQQLKKLFFLQMFDIQHLEKSIRVAFLRMVLNHMSDAI